MPPLNVPRCNHASTSIGSKVYVVAGYDMKKALDLIEFLDFYIFDRGQS